MSAVLDKTAETVEVAPWPTGTQRLALTGVTWNDYELIGEALRDRSALRITYDRGKLEVMTTSGLHEKIKKRGGRVIEVLAEEFGYPVETGGSMTFKEEEKERGLEADDCFWIRNVSLVQGKTDWDPETDPPPDLALEIELSPSPLNRVAIYAALRVPEVWRYKNGSLTVFLLQADQSYQASPTSPTFPGIIIAEIAPFLQPDAEVDYLSMVRALRAWVKKQLAKKKPKPKE